MLRVNADILFFLQDLDNYIRKGMENPYIIWYYRIA